MSIKWLALIVLIIIWIAPIPFMVRKEKKQYNNGKCPKCGHEWRHFDNDHAGAVGLICDSCGNTMWLDWCRQMVKHERVAAEEGKSWLTTN